MIMLKSTHDKILELKDEQISFLKAEIMNLQLNFNRSLKSELRLINENKNLKDKLNKIEKTVRRLENEAKRHTIEML